MSLVDIHLEKVRQHLDEGNLPQWNVLQGADISALQTLSAVYPQIPSSLKALLSRVDGTYWKKYGDVMVNLLILASDVGEDFGYYLLSCEQMIAERDYPDSIADIYDEWLGQDEVISVDNRIDLTLPMSERLCFAHCLNNGGTSRLYLDFHPAQGGTPGQVVRYLHDPDSYLVLADSFDEYLSLLLCSDYAFVSEY